MNTIREWLNGPRDFATGVALYQVYGQDNRLMRALAQGHSSFRQQKLEQALDALLQLGERPATPAQPAKAAVRVAAVELPEAAVAADVDTYREEWLPKYQEMNYLRHQLVNISDDSERGNVAHKILKLERECMRIWAKRDYFLRTGGHMPQETPKADTVTDLNQLHKQLVNVRSSISKAKRVIAEAIEPAKREAAQVKLAGYMMKLEEIERALKDA